MNSLALATPKLVKLIPLLGSDKPGEVIATASAIGRTLNSVGCDWHDLADVVERAALPVVVEQPRQEVTPGPAPELKSWQLTAMDCLRRGAGRLNSTELNFLRSMATLPSQPSGKQYRWLGAIAMSLGLEVVA